MSLLAGLGDALATAPLGGAVAPLGEALQRCLAQLRHGDAGDWEAALAALPALRPTDVDLGNAAVRIGSAAQIDPEARARLHEALQQLHPWRKGPFSLFGIDIDTEWRSDLKWARIAPHLDLGGRRVLDVGCGNGYYALRMLGAGAGYVLGIDPTLRFLAQFRALQHYLDDPRALTASERDALLERCATANMAIYTSNTVGDADKEIPLASPRQPLAHRR